MARTFSKFNFEPSAGRPGTPPDSIRGSAKRYQSDLSMSARRVPYHHVWRGLLSIPSEPNDGLVIIFVANENHLASGTQRGSELPRRQSLPGSTSGESHIVLAPCPCTKVSCARTAPRLQRRNFHQHALQIPINLESVTLNVRKHSVVSRENRKSRGNNEHIIAFK